MGMFKEEARSFEAVARKQSQIYTDAADYGYAYNIENIPTDIARLIESVKSFQEIDKKYPNEPKFVIKRETWEDGVNVVIRIAWEIDEGFECGSEYDITFNKIAKSYSLIKKDCNAYISVSVRSYRTPYKRR